LSYNELSEKAGVSLTTIKAAACGDNISDKTVLTISKALGVSETELFTAEGSSERKLAPKTIRHYHTFLSSVMERAVKWGLMDSNPCHRVDAPKTDKKVTRCLTAQEAAQFLEKLTGEPLDIQVMFSMLLLTGVRRGELLGLEWPDVDFDNATITIKRTSQYTAEKGIYTDTTKTEQSKRIISIPQQLISLLVDYKLEMLHKRFALGSQWVNSDRLFIKWNGEPMHPNTPYALLHKLLNKYGLPIVSLHSLRHTNASIMIANGADIRTVSGRLGHSQTSTTLNIYAHLLQDADERAADIVSDVLYKRA
jgi:integrase